MAPQARSETTRQKTLNAAIDLYRRIARTTPPKANSRVARGILTPGLPRNGA